jgi:hypothetical protein
MTMLTRRPFLTGLAGVWAGSFLVRPARSETAAGALDIRYGWDPDIAGPVTADVHVALHGDNGASGTLADPVRTIGRGIDLLAARGSGSLAIHGGAYREEVTLDQLRGTAQMPYRIHRYGQDRVTITAAEPLTGWIPCPLAEAQALGIPGSGVFVARLPASHIRHGALNALNLHEAGQWRSIAVDRADTSDPETTGDQTTYHPTTFHIDPQDRILAVQDPRLIGLPADAVQGAELLIYHYPNMVSAVPIDGFDPATGQITLIQPGPALQRTNKEPVMRYALRGAPWALTKGTWIARNTRPDEVSVYFWPTDPAALDSNIEISVRPTCIDFGQARHVELFGLEALRAAGADTRSSICIRAIGFDTATGAGQGLRLIHCRVGETMSLVRGYGALYLRGATDLTIQNVSIASARGNFGLFLAGCTNVDARFLHIANTSNSPARFFTLRSSVLAFSLFEDSARDAHANKFNFYEGSDSVLVYGVRCRNVGGYATYQEASRIHFAFCEIPCDPAAQNRALVSQNRAPGANQGGPDGSGDPMLGATFYYWNNSLSADPAHAQKANALQLGPELSSQTHAVFNTILHGGGLAQIYTKNADPAREQRAHNRYTGLSYWQAPKYMWHLGPHEELMRLGQRPSDAGLDMRSVIAAEIAPLFPGFTHWNVDINGRPIDWTTPPIGCQT